MIVINEYDEKWAQYFEEIKLYLMNNLVDYHSIIHVGSTSIPNLASNPIIDVDVVIKSINDLEAITGQLEKIGYYLQGEEWGKYIFAYQNTTFFKHALCVVIKDSNGYNDHVNLKDFLLKHEGYKKRYAGLKRALAATYYNDYDSYNNGKENMIAEMLKKYKNNKPNVMLPNYDECLVNLSSRIMKKYGMFSKYKAIDGLPNLEKYHHIILLLLDGMGSKILEKHLPEDSFLRKHSVKNYSSVFPPTTVAATTSLLTNQMPGETGWIGWHQYFDEVEDDITMFDSTGYYSGKKYENFTNKVLPFSKFYKDFMGYNSELYPAFMKNGAKTFKQLLKNTKKEIEKDFITFTYAYWDNPDLYMHEFGPFSKKVKDFIHKIDNDIKEFSQTLGKDTCLIITSDHGQIDVLNIDLNKFPKLTNCFLRQASLEGRATSFFIKKDKTKEFEKLFNLYFGSFFKLYKKEEFCNDLLIFYRKSNLRFIGDYVAVAKEHYLFEYNDSGFKGHHAGLTTSEMEIPLIYYAGDEKL